MSKPRGVYFNRFKGAALPPNTVLVTRPGPFGNPFKVDGHVANTKAQAVELFDNWLQLEGKAVAARARQELRGKNLACTCRIGQPCHRNVLLRVANETGHEQEDAVLLYAPKHTSVAHPAFETRQLVDDVTQARITGSYKNVIIHLCVELAKRDAIIRKLQARPKR